MRRCVYVGLLCLFFLGCTHSIKRHSLPPLGAEQAGKFAQIAFVDKDFDKAYDLLSESGKQFGTVEQFREFMAKKHPAGFPLSVKLTDYEPVSEQKTVVIYAYGENGTEKFYYRVIMEPVPETGYRVSGFDRSNTPYPQTTPRQPLNP
jgi:hypothetical protein